MSNDQRRLRRAQLIERVRTAEHQQAALRAYEAESTLSKLEALASRTQALASVYVPAGNDLTPADLRSTSLLAHHLRSLSRRADEQAQKARTTADGMRAQLATAERRRDRAESDRRELHRLLLERRFRPETPIPKRSGMDVE